MNAFIPYAQQQDDENLHLPLSQPMADTLDVLGYSGYSSWGLAPYTACSVARRAMLGKVIVMFISWGTREILMHPRKQQREEMAPTNIELRLRIATPRAAGYGDTSLTAPARTLVS